MKIECKIESVVEVNFKKLLAKIVNLIFKKLLSVVGDALRMGYLGFVMPTVLFTHKANHFLLR